jgi:lipopolysaccharide/colanic/teichoic acid biosynthesis glycosyltransferase
MALSASASHDDPRIAWRDPAPIFQPISYEPVRSDHRFAAAHARHQARAAQLDKEPGRSSLKRLFDVMVAGAALLFFAPLFAAIAIAIRATSPGPVLFTQYRYGYRNHRFRIYKFRTMHTHLADRSGVRQTTDGDPRVTAIGRLLRSTSLDELPQLINVIKGDMSLVGPRPHVPGMLAASLPYEHLVPYYFVRHVVRPGVTGLAQVSGYRGSTTEARSAIGRISCDLEYIEKWSLWLDVWIILRTVRREFLSGSGN